MRRLFLGLFLVMVALRSHAQEAALGPGAKCSIEGEVVKAGNGEPLKKARVTLRKAEGRDQPNTTATDTDGRFVLKDIEPGRYQLWVERNGYVRQEYGQRNPNRPGTTLTLQKGQRVRDVLFRLVPSAVIVGRVVDEDQEPLPSVQVQALRYRYVQGKQKTVFVAGASTNDLGEYRLYGLAPGRYFLSATYRPGTMFYGSSVVVRRGDSEADEGYAPTYYPGTNDVARATSLELRAGEEVGGMDFTLLPTRTVRVRGRVLNAVTGGTGRGATVMLTPRERSYNFFLSRNETSVEDAQGTFELRGVTPGSYTITAMWWEDGKSYAARQPLDVGKADAQGINLVIAPGIDLSGRLLIEGKADIPLADMGIHLSPSEDSMGMGGAGAKVKSDGTFLLQNVADDAYRIFVENLPPDYYLKAATLGPENVLEKGLDIRHGQDLSRLELVVSSAGGRIEGQALTEEQLPATGCIVALIPEPRYRSQTAFFKSSTTDQFGHFTLRGIPPGEYKLFAWDDIEPGAYQNPDFLRPYEQKGKSVHVDEGGRVTIELRLIRGTGSES